MDDSSSSNNEFINHLIKRNNHAVQRAYDSMVRALAVQAAQAASSPICSPWQQQIYKMVAQN